MLALVSALVLMGSTAAIAQTFPPFPEPAVGPFPDTVNMTLESQLLPAEIGAVTPRSGVLLNDIWGWTSPDGEEYALVGTGDGMSIVRVTDPANPVHIGIVPTTAPDSVANLWGDVGVYDAADESYAYFTTEADAVGIHILALRQLDGMGPAPDPSHAIPPTAVFSEGGYDSAHNIYVNQRTGFAYIAGVGLTDGPTACDDHTYHPSRFNAMILDLKSDPLNPSIAACLADHAEHDFYVVNYNGPDRDYQKREIAFVFDGRDRDTASRGGMRTDDTPGELVGGMTEIWDVTDKSDIKLISSFSVPDMCFSHQGWTSGPRHEFLLINDEVDEIRDAEDADGFFRNNFCSTDNPPNTLSGPGMYVLNVKDLDNPVFQERFEIDSPGDNDHNFMRVENKIFWAVYNAGTRVVRVREVGGMLRLQDLAHMDTEPRDDAPVFNGQWGIYAFANSGTIIASDINNGLMIMTLNR